jgi:hypothetical protein
MSWSTCSASSSGAPPGGPCAAKIRYTHLDQLAEVSESELEKLHGMGPTALAALRAALEGSGVSFRS